jgi:general secretion pathway protein C
MLARLAAFIVWALVAASVVFWGLRLLVRAPTAPPHSIAGSGSTMAAGDLTRLLGAAPVAAAATAALAPEAASRFRLHGVMAPKGKPAAPPSGQGVALISVDGKPPRAFAIGSYLDRDLVLQSVSLRTASIGPAQGGASVKLELPPLPLPATGRLPPASAAVPDGMGTPPSVPPTMIPPVPGLSQATPPTPAPVSRPPHSVAPRRESVNTR